MYRISIIFFVILTSCLSNPTIPRNEYDLEVVNTIELYEQLVSKNPSHKLVELETEITGITLDIRYSTENNFTKQKVYTQAKAYLRKPVAHALLQVQKELNTSGLGLKIFDTYRPYAATLLFYEIIGDPNFVADPQYGSRHNRGCAVDVSLVDLKTGKELEMPTPFDEFSERAAPDYPDISKQAKKNRRLLIETMNKYGFTVYPHEWWHFDFKGWEAFPLMDIGFEELE